VSWSYWFDQIVVFHVDCDEIKLQIIDVIAITSAKWRHQNNVTNSILPAPLPPLKFLVTPVSLTKASSWYFFSSKFVQGTTPASPTKTSSWLNSFEQSLNHQNWPRLSDEIAWWIRIFQLSWVWTSIWVEPSLSGLGEYHFSVVPAQCRGYTVKKCWPEYSVRLLFNFTPVSVRQV